MLNTNKVLLFLKFVDTLDREKVGLLLETNEGLMTDWAVVKRVCGRFDKRREWNDVGSSVGWPDCWEEVGRTNSDLVGRYKEVARVGRFRLTW